MTDHPLEVMRKLAEQGARVPIYNKCGVKLGKMTADSVAQDEGSVCMKKLYYSIQALFEVVENQLPRRVYQVRKTSLVGGYGPEAIGAESYTDSLGFFYSRHLAELRAREELGSYIISHNVEGGR